MNDGQLGVENASKVYPNAFFDLSQKNHHQVMKINKDGSQPRIVAFFI